MGWHMWEGAYGPGWGWMLLSHALWWVVLVAAGVALWRWTVGRRDGAPPAEGSEDAALRVLRERYARGEIDLTEFEERRRHLAA
jgi:putative membrane protein